MLIDLANWPSAGQSATGTAAESKLGHADLQGGSPPGPGHHHRDLACPSFVLLSEMGEHEAARELDADTLRRCRRVLGKDHPEARRAAGNLARDLRAFREMGWRGWRARLRRRVTAWWRAWRGRHRAE